MTATWLGVAAAALSLLVLIFKYFLGKKRAKAKAADAADAKFNQGEKNGDASQIVGGLDDIDNA